MRTLLGHAAAGADPFWLLIGAAGGLHHTLALVASGVAVGGPARPVAMAWSALRFTGCMAIGLLAAGVSLFLVSNSVVTLLCRLPSVL